MIAPNRPLRVVMAALTPGTAGFSELASTLRERDWHDTVGVANRHFVTPTLYGNLRDAGLLPVLPTAVTAFLQRVHELNARRNVRVTAQLAELLAAFQDDGAECLLLKGAADLPTLPESRLGDRITSDLDVLIRPDDLARSRALLRGLGYAWDGAHAGRHSDGNYARPGDPAGIDLHLRVEEEDELLPSAEVWRASAERRWRGAAFRVPCPEHRLTHLVLHDMLHDGGYYAGKLRLRPLHDVRCFVDAWGGRLDWSAIQAHFDRFRLRPMLQAHLLAAHRFLGSPWPLRQAPGPFARLAVLRFIATANGALPRFVPYGIAKASGGLAWHRMRRLYGARGGSAAVWRLRHLAGWTARIQSPGPGRSGAGPE